MGSRRSRRSCTRPGKGTARRAEALDDAAYWLGFGLRALVRLFDPEVVVLGGTLGQVYGARGDRVLETLHEQDGIDFAQNVSVRPGALGPDGPLLGAAEMALAPLLADPLTVMTAYRNRGDGPPRPVPEIPKVSPKARGLPA